MPRLAMLAATLAPLVACSFTYPRTMDMRSERPLREAHQCITEQVVDAGFRVTDTSRDDGVVVAEGVLRGDGDYSVWHLFDALVFERLDGSTSVRVTVASKYTPDSRWGDPEPEVVSLAERVSETCQ